MWIGGSALLQIKLDGEDLQCPEIKDDRYTQRGVTGENTVAVWNLRTGYDLWLKWLKRQKT